MKLSSLTPTDKIKLAAELDGWTWRKTTSPYQGDGWWSFDNRGPFTEREMSYANGFYKLATSYDAIIPLIQKHKLHWVKFSEYLVKQINTTPYGLSAMDMYDATPSQLLDALLVATGKAEL